MPTYATITGSAIAPDGNAITAKVFARPLTNFGLVKFQDGDGTVSLGRVEGSVYPDGLIYGSVGSEDPTPGLKIPLNTDPVDPWWDFYLEVPDGRGGLRQVPLGRAVITADIGIDELLDIQLTAIDTALLESVQEAVTSVEGVVVEVETLRDESQALRDDQAAISGLTGEDGAVALLVGNPTSSTRVSLGRDFIQAITPEKFMAVGDSVADDYAALQAAVDSARAANAPRLLQLRPGAVYRTSKEIQFRADFMALQGNGAVILGPTAPTPEGGIVTVVDRVNKGRTIRWTSMSNLRVISRHAADNPINAVTAEHFIWIGLQADMEIAGQRGFALQTRPEYLGLLQDGQIIGCESVGGVNGFNIDTTSADRVTDISVRGMKIRNAAVAIRASAGGSAFRHRRINVSGVEMVNCAQGASWYHCADSVLSDFRMTGVTGRAIDSQWSDGSIRDFKISGAAADFAIALSNGAAGLRVSRGHIDGPYGAAIYNAIDNLTVREMSIKNATIGIQNTSTTQRGSYEDIMFEDVATPFNAYRAGDLYRSLARRSGTIVEDITPYGTSSIDVPVFGYVSAVTYTSLTARGIQSTGVQNSLVNYRATPRFGTYTIRLAHNKGPDRGIYSVQVDGVTVGTIDGYAAASADALSEVAGVVMSTGEKLITLKMENKNAASSSYFGSHFALSLVRTA